MYAGRLRETIVITEPVVAKDEFGANNRAWKELLRTRANVKIKNGQRAVENNEVINTYVVEFSIRLYHNINENMVIRWNGNRYRILAIDKNLYKQCLIIQAEKINE